MTGVIDVLAHLDGHTIRRRAKAGRSWWTVDEDLTPFPSLRAAADHVRHVPARRGR